jgi:hypothetical protein
VAYTAMIRVLSLHFPFRKKNNSVVEVSRVLIFIHDILVYVKPQKFTSLEVKTLIEKKRRKGLDAACDKFCAEVKILENI